MFVQRPLLTTGSLPVKITGKSHSVISVAIATTIKLCTNTSSDIEQPPSVTVHLNLFKPNPKLEIVELNKVELVILPPPPSSVHFPEPKPG